MWIQTRRGRAEQRGAGLYVNIAFVAPQGRQTEPNPPYLPPTRHRAYAPFPPTSSLATMSPHGGRTHVPVRDRYPGTGTVVHVTNVPTSTCGQTLTGSAPRSPSCAGLCRPVPSSVGSLAENAGPYTPRTLPKTPTSGHSWPSTLWISDSHVSCCQSGDVIDDPLNVIQGCKVVAALIDAFKAHKSRL